MQHLRTVWISLCWALMASNLFLNTPTTAHGVPKSTPKQAGQGAQEQAKQGAQANQLTEDSPDPLEIRLPA
ncbi:MAG: hypothetical protein ACKOX5_00110, partial [Bacteroidota bacterium]